MNKIRRSNDAPQGIVDYHYSYEFETENEGIWRVVARVQEIRNKKKNRAPTKKAELVVMAPAARKSFTAFPLMINDLSVLEERWETEVVVRKRALISVIDSMLWRVEMRDKRVLYVAYMILLSHTRFEEARARLAALAQ